MAPVVTRSLAGVVLVATLVWVSLAASDPGRPVETQPRRVAEYLGMMSNPGYLSSGHQKLEGGCAACHSPFHGQDSTKCIACHANGRAVLERQPTAFHATIRRCNGCHVEHAGKTASITRMDHVALAVELAREANASGNGDGSPPSAQRRTQTRGASASELERGLDCNRCHANQDKHRGLFGGDCAECHGTSGWRVSGYRHPSQGSRECAQCHLAPPSHHMMHFHMVSEMVVGLEHVDVRRCFLCHQTTAWNDIRGVGWYKHH